MFSTVKTLALSVILIFNFQFSIFNLAYAQEGAGDQGSAGVNSDTYDSSNNSGQEADQGNQGVEQAPDASYSDPTNGTGWSDDPSFTEVTIDSGDSQPASGDDNGGGGGGLTPGSHDSWATDQNFGSQENVTQATQDLQSFQDAYAGQDLTPEQSQQLSDLQQAVDTAQEAFNAVQPGTYTEATSIETASQELSNALSNVAPEDYSSTFSNVLGPITQGMDWGQISNVVGNVIGDPVAAAQYMASYTATHGGTVGDILGSATFAFSTSGDNNVNGLQNFQATLDAARAAGVDFDSPGALEAAIATGNTWGVSPADMFGVFDAMGVSHGNIALAAAAQNTSFQGVASGANPGQSAQAAANSGPVTAPAAAPEPAAGTPAEVPAPPPAPAPGRPTNPAPGAGEAPLGGPIAPAPVPAGPDTGTQNTVSIAQPTEGTIEGRNEPTSQGFVDRVYSANFPITDNVTGQQTGNVAVNARDVDNRFDPDGKRDEVTVTVNNWGGSNTSPSVTIDQVITGGNIDVGKVDKIVEQNR